MKSLSALANAVGALSDGARKNRANSVLAILADIEKKSGAAAAEAAYRKTLRHALIDTDTILLACERVNDLVRLLEAAASGDNELTPGAIQTLCAVVLDKVARIGRAAEALELP